MVKAKVIVFDLFDTLIHDIKFDFISGLVYLHENILSKDTDKKEFLDYADTYWREIYDKRSLDNREIAFEDELLDFKNKYGFKEDGDIEEIQYNCALKMNVTELFGDTISTLDELRDLGIPAYILSNTIFKKNVMRNFINQYDLEKYFVNTFFSADHEVRKPHSDFFKLVFDEIRKSDISIKFHEIYFVGDNFEADVLGAKNFGFTPVFLNRKESNGINDENCIQIKSLKELIGVIR